MHRPVRKTSCLQRDEGRGHYLRAQVTHGRARDGFSPWKPQQWHMCLVPPQPAGRGHETRSGCSAHEARSLLSKGAYCSHLHTGTHSHTHSHVSTLVSTLAPSHTFTYTLTPCNMLLHTLTFTHTNARVHTHTDTSSSTGT